VREESDLVEESLGDNLDEEEVDVDEVGDTAESGRPEIDEEDEEELEDLSSVIEDDEDDEEAKEPGRRPAGSARGRQAYGIRDEGDEGKEGEEETSLLTPEEEADLDILGDELDEADLEETGLGGSGAGYDRFGRGYSGYEDDEYGHGRRVLPVEDEGDIDAAGLLGVDDEQDEERFLKRPKVKRKGKRRNDEVKLRRVRDYEDAEDLDIDPDEVQ
jgi:hypothetical protein